MADKRESKKQPQTGQGVTHDLDEIDDEMLENLDVLMNMDLLTEEQSWILFNGLEDIDLMKTDGE